MSTTKNEDKKNQSRSGFLTIEKPFENAEKEYQKNRELPAEMLCDYALKLILKFMNNAKNHKPRSEQTNYGACAIEKTRAGYHAHLILASKSAITRESIEKCFEHLKYCEPRYGSIKDGLLYLAKDGRHREKSIQSLHAPVEGGYYVPPSSSKQSKKTFSEIVDEELSKGATPQQLYAKSVRFSMMATAIEKTFWSRKALEVPRIRDVKIIYHYGDTGTGKSNVMWKLEKEHGRENVFQAHFGNPNMFDNYMGEEYLILDELKPNARIRPEELLALLDRYSMGAHARYSDKLMLWKELHLTSTFKPEDVMKKAIYSRQERIVEEDGSVHYEPNMAQENIDNKNTEELMRRLDCVCFHGVDGGAINYKRDPGLATDDELKTIDNNPYFEMCVPLEIYRNMNEATKDSIAKEFSNEKAEIEKAKELAKGTSWEVPIKKLGLTNKELTELFIKSVPDYINADKIDGIMKFVRGKQRSKQGNS